jgi:hypothetical protein
VPAGVRAVEREPSRQFHGHRDALHDEALRHAGRASTAAQDRAARPRESPGDVSAPGLRRPGDDVPRGLGAASVTRPEPPPRQACEPAKGGRQRSDVVVLIPPEPRRQRRRRPQSTASAFPARGLGDARDRALRPLPTHDTGRSGTQAQGCGDAQRAPNQPSDPNPAPSRNEPDRPVEHPPAPSEEEIQGSIRGGMPDQPFRHGQRHFCPRRSRKTPTQTPNTKGQSGTHHQHAHQPQGFQREQLTRSSTKLVTPIGNEPKTRASVRYERRTDPNALLRRNLPDTKPVTNTYNTRLQNGAHSGC